MNESSNVGDRKMCSDSYAVGNNQIKKCRSSIFGSIGKYNLPLKTKRTFPHYFNCDISRLGRRDEVQRFYE